MTDPRIEAVAQRLYDFAVSDGSILETDPYIAQSEPYQEMWRDRARIVLGDADAALVAEGNRP